MSVVQFGYRFNLNSAWHHNGFVSLLQELQGLIDEANQSLEESGTPSHEIMVIVLHREFSSGSIGITLAGGADYENKDITVSDKTTPQILRHALLELRH